MLASYSIRLGVVLALLAAFAAGCGEDATAIVLTVDSSRQVPDEIDRLLIRVSAEGYEDKTESRDLEGPFPHTLAIDLEPEISRVQVLVYGMKGTVEVSSISVELRPVPGEVITADVVI
ncbi:MAG: hypothetical protein ACOCVR_00665 [Myxococcota bacterium]